MKPSEETKRKISETLKGRKFSLEHRKKISVNNSRYWLGKKRPGLFGEKHWRWKGGKTHLNGYLVVLSQNGVNRYRREHCLITEKSIGRKLLKGEQVHHIDGNKLNNNLDNLFLMKDVREHAKLHKQLESLALELVREGKIGFKDGLYFRKDVLL